MFIQSSKVFFNCVYAPGFFLIVLVSFMKAIYNAQLGKFQSVETLCVAVSWRIHVIICLSKPSGCAVLRGTTWKLWTLSECAGWCRYVSCNKYTTLLVGVDSQGAYESVGLGGTWENSVPSTQLCCEPKIKTCTQRLTEPLMYNCKTTKISSVGESVNKLWYIQTMEYYPVL